MTVIAGLVDNGSVVIGGDSAGVAGSRLTVRRDPKVFTVGPYVFGFTTSFRMGQLIRWSFTPPAAEDGDLERFMATTWVDALRESLKRGGWAQKDSEQERGGTFLVGIRGRLFRIEGDYQVGEALDGYDAVGCGADIACGALHATAALGLQAEDRVRLALAAAERHSTDVRGPFTIAQEGV